MTAGGDPTPAAELVVRLLRERGRTVVTAESLTGGLIGAALTAVPGASAVYRGGVIVYATELKHQLLGVQAALLARVGAVDAEVAVAMAEGARRLLGGDHAVAVTGVAGPDPQDGHPPGTVWLGLAGPDGARAVDISSAGDRARIRRATVLGALRHLAAAVRGPSEEALPDSR